MLKREKAPLEKVTFNAYAGDIAKLRHWHGRIGYSKVIRMLIRAHITRVEHRSVEDDKGNPTRFIYE